MKSCLHDRDHEGDVGELLGGRSNGMPSPTPISGMAKRPGGGPDIKPVSRNPQIGGSARYEGGWLSLVAVVAVDELVEQARRSG